MALIEGYDPMVVGIIYDVANGYFIKEDLRGALQLTMPPQSLSIFVLD